MTQEDGAAPIGAEFGLTTQEAERRLADEGPNQIAEARHVSRLAVLVRQFTSLLILILIVAAVIAAVMGEGVDAIAILAVVLLNGILGYVQEWRTETAIAALKRMLTTEARVVRDGRQVMLDTRLIVPGDLVILESGDKIPADISLRSAQRLKADESVLTGESVPVEKSAEPGANQLFMGASIATGRGEGVVTATGSGTEFGQIAALTASIDRERTHLQVQLARLARLLGALAVGLAALVLVVGVLLGKPPGEMFVTAIALSVAMVPEGLPAVITITLALGASAMLRRQALVRRLQAVETLGAANVICTDKTGTLTENAMTVAEVWTPDARYDVAGSGYDPAGHIARQGQRQRHADDPALARLLDVALTCNNAALYRDGETWHMVGDPTEAALVTLAYKGWAPLPDPAARVSEFPFDAERKRMSVVTGAGDAFVLQVKGAPEAVLSVSSRIARGTTSAEPLTQADRDTIEAAATAMAERGQRVLALAQRATTETDGEESDLVFLGLVGMIDPPRPEVHRALDLCRRAGIRVHMVTGDAPATAGAIARDIGLPVDRVVTGAEIDAATDSDLADWLASGAHFARVAPAHKMRIVRALQDQGALVAMTGDGVNDAPALRQASIGIAMGIRGTDVAKDASDLVLLDDNFATIVSAVEEGRRQFANIQRFVRYLLSSNAGEVVAIVANLYFGGPLIFLATQILWMNLITDGVTAVALGAEKAPPDQMDQPPVPKDNPVLDRAGLLLILCFGLYTGSVSLWLFYTTLPLGEDLARTMAFTAMVVFEKVSVFAFRSFRLPFHRVGFWSNRALIVAFSSMLALQIAAVYWGPLQKLLHTTALSLTDLGTIALFALPLIAVPEAIKLLRYWSRGARRGH